MAFITDEDYNVQLRNEIKQIIDSSVDSIKLRSAELMAIAQIKNHLAGRYDLDSIFIDAPVAPEPDTRNQFILMITIDLALYHLWSKEGYNNIPTIRTDRYVDAIDWLKSVADGKPADLPPLTDDSGSEVSDVRIWSKHASESNRY